MTHNSSINNRVIPEPPILTEGEIQAAYMDMFNKGQNAVLQLGRPHMSLMEWRDEQLKRLKESRNG